MATLNILLFTVGIISSFLIPTQGADKYTDGNRPYEFGFNIDGEQHRHEKKDEKGLIMGEFGFITADGVYHVTVYATDEQGRFKILSMKNIRVKPYPTYNKQLDGSARQGHSLDLETPRDTKTQAASPMQKSKFKEISIEKPAKSCSSCSLPPTTTQAPKSAFVQQNVQNTANNFAQNPASVNRQFPQQVKPNSFSNQQSGFSNQNVGSPAKPPTFPANPQNNFNSPQTFPQQGSLPAGNQNIGPSTPLGKGLVAPNPDSPSYPAISNPQTYTKEPIFPLLNSQPSVSDYPQQPDIPNYSDRNPEAPQNYPSEPQSNYPADTGLQGFEPNVPSGSNVNSGGSAGGRTAKKYDGEPQQTFGSQGTQPNAILNNGGGFNQGQTLPDKPTLISAQMQVVDKNTDIYQRGPGEREGLPNGLTKDDMSQLLYTFNYTVGFHGHFEEGFRNGAKQGYYFITGRNGVRTRVDYVADEKGFRPKISQEVLDLLSEDVPKPETEKDEKYGLKGYEFKWLYFPVASNGR